MSFETQNSKLETRELAIEDPTRHSVESQAMYLVRAQPPQTDSDSEHRTPNPEPRAPSPEFPNQQSDAALPLLLEVGCEEIPARFLADAQRDLGDRLQKALIEARLIANEPQAMTNVAVDEARGKPRSGGARIQAASTGVTTFSTPRRLIAHVASVLAKQPDQTEDVIGPPFKVAFDSDGKPTRAAESFANKNGVEVKDLLQVETTKGLYLAAKKRTPGRPAHEVLAALLPKVIGGMTFPKSMVWEETGLHFVRPIRWILALLGEGTTAQLVPFEVAGVKSGIVTHSHRLTRRALVSVSAFKDYANKLRRGHVEISPERRRKRIRQGIQALLAVGSFDGSSVSGEHVSPPEAPSSDIEVPVAAQSPAANGQSPIPSPDAQAPISESGPRTRIIPDQLLEDWIVASTEWPNPILGSFEPRFLELPREILITVMRDHQKYFALESTQATSEGSAPWEGSAPDGGRLLANFVTVLNVPGDPEGIIQRGHERVLTARLEDASFFWHADQKIPLHERVWKLERVTYHDKLGSYADKIKRVRAIAESISAELERQGKLGAGQRGHVLRAVDLCKCDLTTQMVQEFTELQGVVGGLYGKAQDEPEEVWQAIYDHYKPVNLEDWCPRAVVGAIVSMADKLDAVIAGFSVGLEPTGSSDPFGLRRAGNGITKIAIEATPGLDLSKLAGEANKFVAQGLSDPAALGWARIAAFLSERLAFYLETRAVLRYDTIRAVLSPEVPDSWSVPSRTLERGRALERARESNDFQALAVAAKRTRNILTKSAMPEDFGTVKSVSPELLKAPEERELYRAYEGARADLINFEAHSDYTEAFRRLASLRPAVDRFFDKVMVMDSDLALRANRLRLLTDLDALAFRRFADLSEIEAASS